MMTDQGHAQTILAVDDDALVLQTIVMLLEDNGFNVVTASDGVEGLQKYEKFHPDLVVSDIFMPEKDGLGLISHIRQRSSDVKIIAISGGGFAESDYIPLAIKVGANIGIHKPFDDQVLVGAVRSLIGDATN